MNAGLPILLLLTTSWARAQAPKTAAIAPAVAASSQTSPLPDLLARLKSEDSQAARLAIVRELTKPAFHGDAAQAALGHALNEDLSDKVRAAAGAALLSYDGEAPVRVIEAALGTEQGEGVRLALCQALSTSAVHADDPAATEALEQILAQDPAASARVCAARGLGRRGDRRALPALNAASLRDEDAGVRQAAKKAFAAVSIPPKKPAPPKEPAKPMETLDEDGHLHCGPDGGVCQCTNGVITPKPHCLTLEDCRHLYETTYQNEGNFGCTWDGQDVEQQR